MLNLKIDPHSSTPPSQQLQDAVLDAVATAALVPGDKLPSVRTVAEQALVNPNTVGKAWRALELMGVVVGRNGSGVFIEAAAPKIARRLRGDATLSEFERAAHAAIRAGHAHAMLKELLDSTLPHPDPVRGKKS